MEKERDGWTGWMIAGVDSRGDGKVGEKFRSDPAKIKDNNTRGS